MICYYIICFDPESSSFFSYIQCAFKVEMQTLSNMLDGQDPPRYLPQNLMIAVIWSCSLTSYCLQRVKQWTLIPTPVFLPCPHSIVFTILSNATLFAIIQLRAPLWQPYGVMTSKRFSLAQVLRLKAIILPILLCLQLFLA